MNYGHGKYQGIIVKLKVIVRVKGQCRGLRQGQKKVRVKVRVRNPSSGLIQTRTDTRSRIRTGIRTEYADS